MNEKEEKDLQWVDLYYKGELTVYQINAFGDIRNRYKSYILTRTYNRDGYALVRAVHNGKKITFIPHREVAKAFVPNPENKPEVNHINGDKTDCCYKNLEWCTRSENILHAYRTGLLKGKSGEQNPANINKEAQIHKVCELLEKGVKSNLIREITGVKKGVIHEIKAGRLWKHISCRYNIPEPKHKLDTTAFRDEIDDMIISGLSNEEIRERFPLDITNTQYENLLKDSRKRLKKQSSREKVQRLTIKLFT